MPPDSRMAASSAPASGGTTTLHSRLPLSASSATTRSGRSE